MVNQKGCKKFFLILILLFSCKGVAVKKICVMGLGYIGLPTSIVAAESGHDVIGFDINEQRVARINNADPVIKEPDIAPKLKAVLKTKRFVAKTTLEPADYFIIAVPTPFKDGKKADLSYVYHAARLISPFLEKGNTVILESTSPVGTTDDVAAVLQAETGLKKGEEFFVAHCPERVLPGKIFYEITHNSRIIGGINKASLNAARDFYKTFVKGEMFLTNATTAEMVKLVENSSRDVQIAFANQVASMAYSIGLNPYEVIELANKHPRVNVLNPSCGVGGHCIAVDPWFLIESFPEHTNLLKTARWVNDIKPQEVIRKINKEVGMWRVKNMDKQCKVLLLGATYKANVDDLRESPALHIARLLSGMKNMDILVCEPHVNNSDLERAAEVTAIDLEEGLAMSDVVVCLVAHNQFKYLPTIDFKNQKVMDFCGLFHQDRIATGQEQLFWPASTPDDIEEQD
ncbi:nucleotide sugar dehydrogenase, partial [bacterium]|nr:nucleotide sugar dehydrogenase [bacterium]